MISNTFKVDFWDTEAIADRIVSLAENPSLKNSMSGNVLKEVQSFTYEKSAHETKMIYHHVIGAVA